MALALQSFVKVVEQHDILVLINTCLTGEAVLGDMGAVCPVNLHDTCTVLRKATARALQPLPRATRSLQTPQRESNLQRELAAMLAAQLLAGGAPGPGTP